MKQENSEDLAAIGNTQRHSPATTGSSPPVEESGLSKTLTLPEGKRFYRFAH